MRHGAEHRAEDGAEDGGAERGPDQLAAASRGVATVSQASAPAHVVVLEKPCTSRASTERPGSFGGGEREAGDREEDEASDDGALRPPARGREPAGDPAEQRAGAEGGDEQPGAVFESPNSSA